MSNTPTPALVVSVVQRVELERLARSRMAEHRRVVQARALLLAADGAATIAISRELAVAPESVRRWRRRFAATGISSIGWVAPGRGRKPRLAPGTVPEIVRVTLEERPPDGATEWTTRSLARRIGVHRETIRRVWLDHDLKPWRRDTFKLSTDPDFEAKLVDVVGLYLDPPARAVVVSFDEKTQCQALDRTQPSLPLKRGRSQTLTHDYKRHGTVDLFAALELASGSVLTDLRPTHTGRDVLAFFKKIDRSVARELEIHVVLDNLSAHKAAEVRLWLAKPRQSRWHLHFTPTSSSWLNSEGWFAQLTQKRLRNGSFCSVAHLQDAISLWADTWNADPKPFIWHAEANAILTKIQRGRDTLKQNTKSTSDH